MEKSVGVRVPSLALSIEITSLEHRRPILRQFEVMQLVITGMLNKQIAGELGTQEKAIKVHRGRVIKKLGVPSVAELVRLVEKARIAPRCVV